MAGIRQAQRTPIQRFLSDPGVAVIAYFFWYLFKMLPVHAASEMGAFLGKTAGCFMKKRNKIAMRNLEIAFPEKTKKERLLILKRMWQHWGRFYAEMPHAKQLFESAEFEGLSHLVKAFKAGRGGFVCSAHFGNWELATSCPIVPGLILNPVYRPANNPYLDKLMFQRREGVLIPKGPLGARKMLEVLHQKKFVVILCDQKLREGIEVPFFGKPAKSPSAIATLALKMQLPIVMARTLRRKDGSFLISVFPPLELPVGKDAEKKLMKRINQIIEEWIRENPEQWLWIHRRFDKSEYI